jgi:peptide methionine sulfoxide reductase msrA/msrB
LEAAKIFDKKIAVSVLPFKNFFAAEEYHQNYAEENTLKYCAYRESSGRDEFLEKYFNGKTWEQLVNNEKVTSGFSNYKKPSDKELKKKLTKLQYDVTQKKGTEKPFDNQYTDNYAAGIYVDILSGEPLFSSVDKYDSGTGWPSFVKPINTQFIVEKEDRKLFSVRTEIRSKFGDNHLGHVFSDGPQERGGMRYCINSAALKFIPKDQMEKEGYEMYLDHVK